MKTAWLLYLIFGVLMFWNRISWPWSPDSPASLPPKCWDCRVLPPQPPCWLTWISADVLLSTMWGSLTFPCPSGTWHLTLCESHLCFWTFSTAVTVLHRGFATSSGSYCHRAPDMWVPTPRPLLCTFFATRFNNVLMSRVTSWGSPCQLHWA